MPDMREVVGCGELMPQAMIEKEGLVDKDVVGPRRKGPLEGLPPFQFNRGARILQHNRKIQVRKPWRPNLTKPVDRPPLR